MKKIYNTLSGLLSRCKGARRSKNAAKRIEEIRESIQLTSSNGKVYISHKGVGVQEINSDIQVATAVEILERMRKDACEFVLHEEKLLDNATYV